MAGVAEVHYEATCLTCGVESSMVGIIADQNIVESWMVGHLNCEPLHVILSQMVTSQIVISEKGLIAHVASTN